MREPVLWLVMTTQEPEILCTQHEGVLEVCFNRPEKKNAFTEGMYETLAGSLREADASNEVRVVLLRGAGGTFTAGNDLGDFLASPPTGSDSAVFRFLFAITQLETPVVAAVQGAAVGIGTTMLQHVDLVYAAESTTFALPFVDLGLCPEAASSLLLPRQMGHARAAELLMLGKRFGPSVALDAGIVTSVVSDAEVDSVARAAARALAAKPPESLRLTKELMRRWDRDLIQRALREEGEAFVRQLQSPEAKAAFAAFAQRRSSSKGGR